MSGRNSGAGTPESRSSERTCFAGQCSHCSTAWRVMPNSRATARDPPARSTAIRVTVFMRAMIGTTCQDRQVFLSSFRKKGLRSAAPKIALPGMFRSYGVGEVVSIKPHEFIKKRRTELGLSQQALADLVGVSRAAVGLWEKSPENGGSFPTQKYIPALVTALRTTADKVDIRKSFRIKWDKDSGPFASNHNGIQHGPTCCEGECIFGFQ